MVDEPVVDNIVGNRGSGCIIGSLETSDVKDRLKCIATGNSVRIPAGTTVIGELIIISDLNLNFVCSVVKRLRKGDDRSTDGVRDSSRGRYTCSRCSVIRCN